MTVKKPKKIKEFSVVHSDETGKETEKTYILVQPSNKVVRDSRWTYSIIFNQALKDGLLTERQMSQILNIDEKNSSADSDKLAALYIKAATLEKELTETEELTTKQEVADLLRETRAQIFDEEASIRAPYYNTAEQRAEESRIDFLLMYMVCNNDKDCSFVWTTKEEYEVESDMELMDTAKMHLMYWIHNLDFDWEKQLPENVVLDEVLQKMVTEAEEVEEQTEPVIETTSTTKEKPTKKRTTKKRKTKKKASTSKEDTSETPQTVSA